MAKTKAKTQKQAQAEAVKTALASGPDPKEVYRLNVPYRFKRDDLRTPENPGGSGYKKGAVIMNWGKRQGQPALEAGLIEPAPRANAEGATE